MLSQQKKNESYNAQRKRVKCARMRRCKIRARVIMAAASCSPAVASRRAKFADDLRVLARLGAQPFDEKLYFR